MATERKRKVEQAITAIQQRWGAGSIGHLTSQQAAPVPSISTGFPTLDAALGTGGIPQGRISEMISIPTAGMVTMALKTLANAQTQGQLAVYADLERTFDPGYAQRCGVDLDALVLVHPKDMAQATSILTDLVLNAGLGLLVCDLTPAAQAGEALAITLGRLVAPLSRTGGTLLFLTSLPAGGNAALEEVYPAHASIPHYAAVRMLVQKEQWIYGRHDISGYAAQVLIVKNKFAAPGRDVHIAITFDAADAAEETP